MNIYLIAGPPGIGKSTYGRELIPNHVPIVDHDLAAYQYKKKGVADYSELASLKANQFIDFCIKNGDDFALELNLGYQSHYDYVGGLAVARRNILIHLILFFTDHVELCLLRAKVRHQSGGHLVEPDVIRTMYRDTIPLFKKHRRLFASVSLISATDLEIEEVTESNIPDWVLVNDLARHIQN